MYEETKEFVNKAFKIGKLLFGLEPGVYHKLCDEVCKIPQPELPEQSDIDPEEISDFLAEYFKEQYQLAAARAGLKKEYGIAMLEYTALHKEINDRE